MNTMSRCLLLATVVTCAAAPLTACKETGASMLSPCHECGTIATIQPMKQKGEGTGAGALIGAVAGAVVGHQFGGGHGKDVATAGGAIAGGIAGNEIERNKNAVHWYHVTVNMEEGGTRTVDVDQLNGLAVGAKVKVVGNALELASR